MKTINEFWITYGEESILDQIKSQLPAGTTENYHISLSCTQTIANQLLDSLNNQTDLNSWDMIYSSYSNIGIDENQVYVAILGDEEDSSQ